MPIPAELYGPAGAIAALAFVLALIIHGDLAPGFAYRRERDRADKLEATVMDILRGGKDEGR